MPCVGCNGELFKILRNRVKAVNHIALRTKRVIPAESHGRSGNVADNQRSFRRRINSVVRRYYIRLERIGKFKPASGIVVPDCAGTVRIYAQIVRAASRDDIVLYRSGAC